MVDLLKLLFEMVQIVNTADKILEMPPYLVPQDIYLQLHGNSTRIVMSNTEIGFIDLDEFASHLLCHVDDIRQDGGSVVAALVYVTRVYPTIYFDI